MSDYGVPGLRRFDWEVKNDYGHRHRSVEE
jgi:hypothetical protein